MGELHLIADDIEMMEAEIDVAAGAEKLLAAHAAFDEWLAARKMA